MEDRQRQFIVKHFPSLISDIKCTVQFLSILQSEGMLSESDMSTLKAVLLAEGEIAQSRMLLEIIQKRVAGFKILISALFKCRQTGAVLTLLPCGITVSEDSSGYQLQDLYVKLGREDVDEILKNAITNNDDIRTMLTNGGILHLIDNTLPKTVTHFIKRTLTTRKFLNPVAFEVIQDDVFLFQNMEEYKLTKLARASKGTPQGSSGGGFFGLSGKRSSPPQILTDVSSNQLDAVTQRFIHLKREHHFVKISKAASIPVHWIKFDDGKFELVASSGGFRRIKYYLSKEEIRMNQQQFLDHIKNSNAKAVCISDSPGMGKTVLLADLGRNLMKSSPENNVIFVRVVEILQRCSRYPDDVDPQHLKAALASLATSTKLGHEIAMKMISSSHHFTEILLDGYDEISSDQLKQAKYLLRCLKDNFVNTRIIVTSRPHLSNDIEETLSTYAFTIQPFQKEDQIEFLTSYWKDSCDSLGGHDPLKLSPLATKCLETLQMANHSDPERDIAGIPLQCRMLAHVYLQDAIDFAATKFNMNSFRMTNSHLSIFDMYRLHVDKCFAAIADKATREMVIDYHTYEAMALLFPDMTNSNISPLSNEILYHIGLMEATSSSIKPKFLHKTYAEYLIILFIVMCIKNRKYDRLPCWIKGTVNFHFLLFNTVLASISVNRCYSVMALGQLKFVNFVLAYFMDQQIKYFKIEAEFPLRKRVRGSHYSKPETFFEKIYCTVVADCYHLFLLLKNSYVTEGFTRILKRQEDIPWNQLVLCCTKYSSLALLQDCINLVESILGTSLTDITFSGLLFSGTEKLEYSPLHAAVHRGHYHIFDFLKNCYGERIRSLKLLLHLCVENSINNSKAEIADKRQIIKALVDISKEYLDEKEGGSGGTPLLMDRVHIELLTCLISVGARVAARDKSNRNVAHVSATYLSPEDYHVLCMLALFHGKYIFQQSDISGHKPLHTALQTMEILVTTLESLSAASAATFNNFSSVSLNDGIGDLSELFTSVIYGRSRNVIETIIALGGDRFMKNSLNWSVMHVAVFNIAALELVTSFGADVNAVGCFGVTPLHMIFQTDISNDHILAVVKYLLSKGANANSKTIHEETPLHLAIRMRHVMRKAEITRNLIEHGANINAMTFKHSTPLHLAAKLSHRSSLEISKLLLENGARVNARDKCGKTPLAYALQRNNQQLVNLLQSGGVQLERSNMLRLGNSVIYTEEIGATISTTISRPRIYISQENILEPEGDMDWSVIGRIIRAMATGRFPEPLLMEMFSSGEHGIAHVWGYAVCKKLVALGNLVNRR